MKSDSAWDYAVCDGSSCLRRSVLQGRRRVQRLNFCGRCVTVRRAHDGPSCHSVTKFRESISVPNFQNSKYFGTRPARRSIVPTMVRRGARCLCQFFKNQSLLLKTTKQVITIDTNLPIVRPRTIIRRKTRAKRST